MNLQAQQKSSTKRTGKRITYFNEQDIAVSSKEPQQQLKEGQYYSHGGNIPASQTMEIPHTAGLTSAPSNVALMNSVYSQDRGESMMMSQPVTAVKWQNSLMGNRLPERGDAHWQSPPAMWNHSMVFGSNPKGPHANAGAPGFYGHPEALKRNQEKGVFVSQLDLYEDAVQQMMSQKAQLEQQALVRQQAQMNSFHQMQKQQQQNQSLPLQPFQLAFGHQGQKQGLPELLHVFQEAPASSTPAFTAQQKQQALPQLQLFENFYPQQQQQQQAATQAFSLQQTTSIAQPHVAAAAPQHHMMAHQFQQTERNQELFKALTEQNQQTVLPQTQIPFPRRSRRLSKEGVLMTSTGEVLASKQAEEQSGNLFLHHWQTHQQEVPLQQPLESLTHNKSSYSHPKRMDLGQKDVLVNSELCQMETDRQAIAQNGRDAEKQTVAAEENTPRTNDFQGVRGGVIQSTRRRRRVSQEANLLTLAQKAVELASLQNVKESDTSEEKKSVLIAAPGPTAAKSVVEFASSSPSPKKAREDSSLVPLIIPVSVPVRKIDLQNLEKEKSEDGKLQRGQTNDRTSSERKPSVIVTRRRSNRNTNMETSNQHEHAVPKDEAEGFARKPKQRPRPEPLFIPPKAGTFIAPPVYSNITPYQSHLRSPVRLADHPSDRNFELPPYTPPPILSPVREGSGLYFNAILSSSGHPVPPPMTPKSAHRTLLRSNSSEVTPPVLSVVGEATPVSIEPRINVGTRFQAEIPSLQDRSLAAADEHKAELVWQPWGDLETNKVTQQNVENLLAAACSSIFPGAGTNQELALHFLHEEKGSILGALTKLLLKGPVRSPTHPLADYHYTGSDSWKVAEKKLFNKGIAIYKKDFFLVQKLIKTKTVAQCVEFYYTYKKQVKIGRNGTLIFGDIDVGNEKSVRDEAEVDIKSSHRFARVLPLRRDFYSEEQGYMEEEEEEEEEGLDNRKKSILLLKDEQTLQDDLIASDANIRSQEATVTGRIGRRPRETTMKPRKLITAPVQRRRRKQKIKSDVTSKTQNTENTFPCKKCGRVFYKVKSRSAHMKSHAEQEKKAAALKQQEREAAAAAAAAAHSQAQQEESSESGTNSSGSSSGSSDEDGEI
ncbi:ELM2 and SANT domain-containing protein 1 isoform X1 [Numida meleagris]|uniref:ELM2 and SANT domain-containing protein 1 isoform X1 n=2 Tax=Numida meleagris TaxID=8996 RepID=UPI000B3E1924|nr:ELM2 and SANT domain-containing protein 1 isoform X1 [Numida meleagris]XP_021259106.1 ELM2 and SANT domain-containing protein 1 isoform X1 [Numida meleagris]XP_021259107.1 ELM2 and SANT domain-containing protein 1 isoform X1 [Numida meleagris]XP_021259108.1 ELM2 and SANT domain-containing protein 1 isoform X1 [Numida meleagris]XP_021259109.1 ELM2 and SANT domain-containing protein 1 isoform X1 [Numida meleagris]XP_021259110.1 ELM2 and SANT domain-containing protein 1 isoform X1 [Numida mele